MNAVLYHQKERKIGDKTVFLGEDSYPYVDSEVIIVSDGLGGRGGYPHKKFNRNILDENKLFDTLFAPFFEKEVSEDIKNFITASFSELYKTRDFYFDVSSAMKCSGYFASRITTAIALYEIKYNEFFARDELFTKLREADAEEKEKIAQQYGDRLAIFIREKLEKIAEGVGFELETEFKGAYLLPATLTVTLMDERDDGVDVLYLWAGDSRGYIWNENGLAQITEDHEKNEVMTNLVTLSRDFRVEGHFASFKKPCLIFNASDGVYKCHCFESALDLECVFLLSLSNVEKSYAVTPENLSDAMKNLASEFAVIGKHDDSNTMGIHAFGYKDYTEIRKAIEKRYTEINKNIVSRLPDIFQRSYSIELQTAEDKLKGYLQKFKDEFIKEPGVRKYITDIILKELKSKKQEELKPQKNECDKKIEASNPIGKAEREAVLEDAVKFVSSKWIRNPSFKKYLKGDDVRDALRAHNERYEEYKLALDELEALSSEESAIDAEYDSLLSRINEIGRIDNASELEEHNSLAAKVNDCMTRKSEHIKKRENLAQSVEKKRLAIGEVNRFWAKKDKTVIRVNVEMFLQGKAHGELLDVCPELEEYVIAYSGKPFPKTNSPSADAQVEEKKSEAEKIEIPEETILEFWKANAKVAVSDIWNNHRDCLSSELSSKLISEIRKLEESYNEIKRGFDIRAEIYAEYEKSYKRAYRETRI